MAPNPKLLVDLAKVATPLVVEGIGKHVVEAQRNDSKRQETDSAHYENRMSELMDIIKDPNQTEERKIWAQEHYSALLTQREQNSDKHEKHNEKLLEYGKAGAATVLDGVASVAAATSSSVKTLGNTVVTTSAKTLEEGVKRIPKPINRYKR